MDKKFSSESRQAQLNGTEYFRVHRKVYLNKLTEYGQANKKKYWNK